MTHSYMPISLTMKGRTCLVVGGGNIALRKVETLLDYDTKITVVAPDIDPKLEMFAKHNRITIEKRPYKSPEAADYGVVISASDDMALNKQVCEDCRHAGVLVNVADAPSLCDFIFPAVLRRDCLTVALSTDGKAPFMSAHLRPVLKDIFPKHWEKLMQQAVTYRKMVYKRWGDNTLRKNASFEEFVMSDWKTMLKEMSDEEIQFRLQQMMELEPAPEPDNDSGTDSGT